MTLENDERVRLDKWLWAARFFRTRGLAAAAIDGGKVSVNGDRVKRARLIAVGDEVEVRDGPLVWRVTVLQTASRRVSAQLAQGFYSELPASRAERLAALEMLKNQPRFSSYGDGRPGKRDRRAIRRLKGDF